MDAEVGGVYRRPSRTRNRFSPAPSLKLTDELYHASPETLVAFALGLSLFVVTLGLNIIALYVVRKYREQYE